MHTNAVQKRKKGLTEYLGMNDSLTDRHGIIKTGALKNKKRCNNSIKRR